MKMVDEKKRNKADKNTADFLSPVSFNFGKVEESANLSFLRKEQKNEK